MNVPTKRLRWNNWTVFHQRDLAKGVAPIWTWRKEAVDSATGTPFILILVTCGYAQVLIRRGESESWGQVFTTYRKGWFRDWRAKLAALWWAICWLSRRSVL